MSALRKLAYLASLPLLWAMYALSFLAPRRNGRVAFGSLQDQFSDNSRYCFLSLQGCAQGLDLAWISGSDSVVQRLREQGFQAHHRWSLRGLFFCLTARMYVTSGYLSDVNYWCSGACQHLSLWHGIPLKKIERDITVGPLAKQFRPGPSSLPARLALPQKFRTPEYLVSPCRYTDENFGRTFGVEDAALVRSIYPRSAFLIARRRELEARRDGVRTVVFCPTWRDRSDAADLAMLTQTIASLRECCREQGFELRVKLHPNVEKRHNVGALLEGLALKGDLYEALADAGLVVTDYSSILFECLIADVPLMLFSYDGDLYEKASRDLYFSVKQAFAEIRRDSLQGLRLSEQIDTSARHAALYKERFGFHYEDRVTPLIRSLGAPAIPSRSGTGV